MTDDRAAHDGELPWLQEVEDEDGPRGISAGKMLGALLVVLLAAAVVVAIFFWLGRRDVGGNAAPELIRAPTTPYKVKPPTVGGLDVAGESETTFETSAGQNISGQLDTSKLGETQEIAPAPPPVAKRKAPPPSETKVPAAEQSTPAAEAPAGGDGSVVQLGAYRNTAQAERAWLALSSRFPQLGQASKMVVPYSAGGSSGYRLRAAATSPTAAKALCDALQAGGESCFVAK